MATQQIRPDQAGALLQRTVYNPGTTVIVGGFQTEQDLDATNLAVTFTPTSTAVIVSLTGTFYTNAGGINEAWNVREGSTEVAGSQAAIGGPGVTYTRVTHRFLITGLTPGVAKTWKWGAKMAAGSQNVYFVAGQTNPSGLGIPGPAIMEVWAA